MLSITEEKVNGTVWNCNFTVCQNLKLVVFLDVYGTSYLGTKTSNAALFIKWHTSAIHLDRTSLDDKHQSPECLDISLLIVRYILESKGNVWLVFLQRLSHSPQWKVLAEKADSLLLIGFINYRLPPRSSHNSCQDFWNHTREFSACFPKCDWI